MWQLKWNFIAVHYIWIVFLGLLGLVILHPYGNVSAIDAYFFGASASTESGLNVLDLKDLRLYQQVYLYITPIVSNIGFINIIVVAARLYRFHERTGREGSCEAASDRSSSVISDYVSSIFGSGTSDDSSIDLEAQDFEPVVRECVRPHSPSLDKASVIVATGRVTAAPSTGISFAPDVAKPKLSSTLYIPPPKQRDQGEPFAEVNQISLGDEDEHCSRKLSIEGLSRRRSFLHDGAASASIPIQRVAESMFVLGPASTHDTASRHSNAAAPPRFADLPGLSKEVTIGRNSTFRNMTVRDYERLRAIEYRSLKLLLKIVSGYYIGLHLFGAVGLLGWIYGASAIYTDYLADIGIPKSWWAFYSAQTMVNNLGLTLTPDSMMSFKEATWPLLLMTFLAFAGNTCYPVFLRLVIWITSKIVPKKSPTHASLQFLLNHPRRCYTLLFPSKPTWILFGVILTLNFTDVVLIIVLDLHNPAVTDLPPGPRILSALFQAASSRHTGVSVMNLADINPAVQFSLVIMMYIAALPMAISIRASNTYEEKALGVHDRREIREDEQGRKSYVMSHVRNQLSFDLWYISLSTWLICVAEAVRIADNNEPSFSVFSIFFEVVSGYGNVGLSLGHPNVNTSLSGQFKTFSKLVMVFVMIRGRHRCLPYALDRAVMLPREGGLDEEPVDAILDY
ncbi:cation transport protein-domain-containing protein [Nemania sp. FL0916]|nr:cation transport protein-domain-containing protein [Nemania sp. FL0916]